jgi:hypothetical protein
MNPTPHLPPIPTYPSLSVPFRIFLDSGTVSNHTGGFGNDDLHSSNYTVLQLRRLGWKDGQAMWFHVDDVLPDTEEELEKQGVPRDKWDEARGNQHHEGCWRNRVWRGLCWMFPVEDVRRGRT